MQNQILVPECAAKIKLEAQIHNATKYYIVHFIKSQY